jgi:hypothetical protein
MKSKPFLQVRGIQIVGEASTLNINLDLQTLMTRKFEIFSKSYFY